MIAKRAAQPTEQLLSPGLDSLEKLITLTDGHIPTLAELWEEMPLSAEALENIEQSRRAIAEVLLGQSHKMIVILGRCSADSVLGTLQDIEYIQQLQELCPNLLLVARSNGDKPRTGTGPRGIVHEPGGIKAMWKILSQAAEMGVPFTTEMLSLGLWDLQEPLLSAAWLGARDVTNTPLRNQAALLPMPLAVKNSPRGDEASIIDALNAIKVRRQSQKISVPVINAQGQRAWARGVPNNISQIYPEAIMLRGGKIGIHFDQAVIDFTQTKAEETFPGRPPRIILDAAHGNCIVKGKKTPPQQLINLQWVTELLRHKPEYKESIAGVMIEGSLDTNSRTDPLVDFKDLAPLLLELNEIAGQAS
jgi:3-deoxy-7-phosphoheptulonate synthase